MGEIQFCQDSPLPCLSSCQSEISQQPRGDPCYLFFYPSFLHSSLPPSYLFPPPYGHNDMSGDHCQFWYMGIGDIDIEGNGGNH